MEEEAMEAHSEEPRNPHEDEPREDAVPAGKPREKHSRIWSYHESGHALVSLAQVGGHLYGDALRSAIVNGPPVPPPTDTGCLRPGEPPLMDESSAAFARCLRRLVLAKLAGFWGGLVAESLAWGIRSADHDTILGHYESFTEDANCLDWYDGLQGAQGAPLDDYQGIAFSLWAWGHVTTHPWPRLWRYCSLVHARVRNHLREQSKALHALAGAIYKDRHLGPDVAAAIMLHHWTGERPVPGGVAL